MNALAKHLFCGIIISSILLQQLPVPVMAQSSRNTAAVDIVNLTEEDGKVKVSFAPLPEGLTITARVDQDGRGDFLSIASALAMTKTGVIAVSAGIYYEDNLLVPDNVILQGGYNSTNWQRDLNSITTIQGASGNPIFVLQSASALQHLAIRNGSVGVRVARGPATLSRISIADSITALELSPLTEIRVQSSNFVKNTIAISGNSSNRLAVLNSIFQNNQTLVSAPLFAGSSIKNSSFFPDKNTLQNVQEETNTVETTIPLPDAEWKFPNDTNNANATLSFDLSRISDDHKQTVAGPTLSETGGINAVQLFYQLPEGDEIRIVDRSNLSQIVFDSSGQERQLRKWLPLPLSTQLSVLLDLNGDNNLPLQAGISQYARIPELNYSSSLDKGMLSTSSSENLFYRGQNTAKETTLTLDESNKLTDISAALIQAGEDWLKGESLRGMPLEEIGSFKGFMTKVLLSGNTSISLANKNLREQPREQNDTRFFSLLSDYLKLSKPLRLSLDDCTTLIDCAFDTPGVAPFVNYQSFSLRQSTEGLESERGIFNNQGWNNPAGANAQLKISVPNDEDSYLSIHWTLQPFTSTPSTESHIITFANTDTPDINSLSLFMSTDSRLVVKAYDSNGRLHTASSEALTWIAGRKYGVSLSNTENGTVLRRSDNLLLWQSTINFPAINQIEVGKTEISPTALPLVISDLTILPNQGLSHTFSLVQGNEISTVLSDTEQSLAGTASFSGNNLCQPNSLRLREGASSFVVINGTVSGDNCRLSLAVNDSTPAQATVPLTDLRSRLTLIWQWNPVSGKGTITLANRNGVLLSTLASYGSSTVQTPFALRAVNLSSIESLTDIHVNYFLERTSGSYTLANLRGIERYEVLYSENEDAVINGTANKVIVSVRELNANTVPEKMISGLEQGKRYYFAVQAVMESGGSTQSTHTRNIQLTGANATTTVDAATQTENSLPTTLSLRTNQDFLVAYADTTNSSPSSEGGRVLQSPLGETLTLTNGAPGKNAFTAWTLGTDLPVSTNSQPKHIFTIPGEYVISEIRRLNDGNILKQFGFAAIGGASSDHVQVTAEIWTANTDNPEAPWTSKRTGKKIPAIVGVNEPFYLLGKATDVAGSVDEAFTWTYKIHWGDGTIDTSENVKAAYNLTRLVSGTKEQTPLQHRYTNPGVFTIVTEVVDSQGHTGLFENTVIVSKPETYPQSIVSLAGISRLVTISGGTAPYTVEYTDGSTETLGQNQKTFSLPIIESGTVTVSDRFNNEIALPVRLTASPEENHNEVYLPSNRAISITPNSAKAGDVVEVRVEGEEHLFASTQNILFHFGDTLPASLGDQLPALNSPLAFSTSSTVETRPFMNMGLFPAVLTAIDKNGKENKKSFFLEITQARLGTQSNEGIVTGTVPASLGEIPNSVEIWQRNTQSTLLAMLTPNEQGRFIYFVPDNEPQQGLLSIRIKDQKGSATEFTQNIGYSFTDRPEKLFGILETNSTSPLFNTTKTLATNALQPTFFGLSKASSATTLRIASDNPTEYEVSKDAQGAWLIKSTQELEEGSHTFSLLDKDKILLNEYAFTVDRTAPKSPQVTFASWSQVAGTTEPFAYIGAAAKGNASPEQYVQADSNGEFKLSFASFNTGYTLAAADEAGNVSALVQINEADWQDQQTNTWWQKLRPYFMWTLLLLLAAGGLNYARKVRI